MKKAEDYRIDLRDGELLDAVIANDAAAVEKLLLEKANPNCFEDQCQIRPLHFAAVYNSTNVVFLLVRAGANMGAKTSDGYKPIDIAKQLKHQNIVEMLTKLGTNLAPFSRH